jgi:hypothetical protein
MLVLLLWIKGELSSTHVRELAVLEEQFEGVPTDLHMGS